MAPLRSMNTSPDTAADPSAHPAGATASPASGNLLPRNRFLKACRCEPLDRPPVWLMRQAGRVLPEYRKLKETYTFVQLVQNPELAAEVTLQPIRRFDFDAAIYFSDILVIPEAMGQKYRFRESGGIQMDFAVQSAGDVARLEEHAVRERLQYATQALTHIRRDCGERTALIGFSGAPWTLANFMLAGGSSRDYTEGKLLFHSDRKLFDALMEKLTFAVTDYLKLQIEAGVDAVQIFDSLGGMLPETDFEDASGKWIRRIVNELGGAVPVIVFAKGVCDNWEFLQEIGANILGVDWTINLPRLRDRLPTPIGVQGNLDPFLLSTTPDIVARETRRLLESMRGRTGHIFNLGHGVQPSSKLECVGRLVETVKNFS